MLNSYLHETLKFNKLGKNMLAVNGQLYFVKNEAKM